MYHTGFGLWALGSGRLLVFVVVIVTTGVVAGVFFEVGERLERAHAVEKEDAVEAIRFVLDDAGGKVLCVDLDALAVAIEGRHANLRRARHALQVVDQRASVELDLRWLTIANPRPSLAALEALKKSLLHQAFTGQL